jgi:hypothetical protein
MFLPIEESYEPGTLLVRINDIWAAASLSTSRTVASPSPSLRAAQLNLLVQFISEAADVEKLRFALVVALDPSEQSQIHRLVSLSWVSENVCQIGVFSPPFLKLIDIFPEIQGYDGYWNYRLRVARHSIPCRTPCRN